MDISKMSVVELKALWLDQLRTIENSQKNIQVLQAELTKREAEEMNKAQEVVAKVIPDKKAEKKKV